MLGPDGGDGGKGGDIIIIADQSTKQLKGIKKKYKAQDGGNGQVDYCKGKKGKDLIIRVVYLLDSHSVHVKLGNVSHRWFNFLWSNKKIANNFSIFSLVVLISEEASSQHVVIIVWSFF